MKDQDILWFKEIGFDDVNIVGGKGANLGEMYNLGIPVPNGFVVPVNVYFQFIKENNLQPKIADILKTTDVDQPDQLLNASKQIRSIIKKSPINHETGIKIMSAYKKLSDFGGLKDVPVAVRTSATAEDTADASFAGQGDTFLNVTGETNVLHRVRDCWSSLFTPRSIFYQVKKHYNHFKIGVAVPVQKLVQSDISGVMFTVNPVTNEKNQIIVEAIWGLGEYIVQGTVSPDQYIIDKNNWTVFSENHVEQKTELIRAEHETKEINVPKTKQNKIKITPTTAIKIAKIGQKLHQHYGKPQDVEFAIDSKGKLFIVQTRPITTVVSNQKTLDIQTTKISQKPDLTGEQASPGTASGTIIIIKSPKEINRAKKGQILVTSMTTPDFV
ncbi:MAG: PEP/pyruvate-binding domain-containing protein, partial [Candidatus Shapirobacteria bacterium]|nr:PEP/pyruvate-binding domain-containing protein [Candidatus Shapirobacteria bacterium]